MAELITLSPTYYATLTKPRHSPKQVKRILERRYDSLMSHKFTTGYRARECALILQTATDDGVTLDPSVAVGCRFWVLSAERV